MTKKQLFKLLENRELQKRIVSILLSREIVELKLPEKGALFSNITLTDEGKILIDQTVITEEFVAEYRNLFPPGKKGDLNGVTTKLQGLFTEVDVSEEDVMNATQLYLSEITDEKYCMQADYFIEKTTDGTLRQAIRQFLERIQEDDNSSEVKYGEQVI